MDLTYVVYNRGRLVSYFIQLEIILSHLLCGIKLSADHTTPKSTLYPSRILLMFLEGPHPATFLKSLSKRKLTLSIEFNIEIQRCISYAESYIEKTTNGISYVIELLEMT